ncbi:MAG: hypothetical protein L0Z62_36475 [Gemmataceae bacterium]|nr:hypothetical protein [Gemmataceae bacterium]
MAKKKPPKKRDESWPEQLEDLSELAGKLNAPDGFLDDELQDACDADARLTFEEIRRSILLDQLEFLYLRGYQVGRLRELIEEATKKE